MRNDQSNKKLTTAIKLIDIKQKIMAAAKESAGDGGMLVTFKFTDKTGEPCSEDLYVTIAESRIYDSIMWELVNKVKMTLKYCRCCYICNHMISNTTRILSIAIAFARTRNLKRNVFDRHFDRLQRGFDFQYYGGNNLRLIVELEVL